MIKMIATDLDGTLLRNDKSFNPELYDIFYKLKEKDIKFVIATGNQYELVKEKFEKIQDDIIYLVENGNKIVYKDKLLYVCTLTKEENEIVLNKLLEYDELMIIYCGVKHSYIHKKYKSQEKFIKNHYRNYIFIDDYKTINDQVMKYSVADLNGKSFKYVEAIKDNMPDSIQTITAGNEWFDIFKKDINKGTGMKFLQDYFGIDKSECMAFGDQMNDYHLLLSCEESYVMDNGQDEVKKIAKYIAKSNEEDGVIEVMKKLI